MVVRRRSWGGKDLLAAELLEQILELVRGGEKDQALHETRAGLAVRELELLAVGLLVDALDEQTALVGPVELVELEHFVCALEVLLLVLVEHAVEGHGLGAGKALDELFIVDGLVMLVVVVWPGVVLVDALATAFGLELRVVEVQVEVEVAGALALLLVVAAAALLVLLGHVWAGWRWRRRAGDGAFLRCRKIL